MTSEGDHCPGEPRVEYRRPLRGRDMCALQGKKVVSHGVLHSSPSGPGNCNTNHTARLSQSTCARGEKNVSDRELYIYKIVIAMECLCSPVCFKLLRNVRDLIFFPLHITCFPSSKFSYRLLLILYKFELNRWK